MRSMSNQMAKLVSFSELAQKFVCEFVKALLIKLPIFIHQIQALQLQARIRNPYHIIQNF